MTEEEIQKLKFPIGKFHYPKEVSEELKTSWIGIIRNLPTKLEEQLKGITHEQLDFAYRPEGWQIKQVVHHLADSHMNAFIRTKMALTEEAPTIKPYYERRFAKLPDANNYNIESSLAILTGVHARFILLFESIDEEGFSKTYVHPQSKRTYRIDSVLALYAWHSMHHLGHVNQALSSNGAYNPENLELK